MRIARFVISRRSKKLVAVQHSEVINEQETYNYVNIVDSHLCHSNNIAVNILDGHAQQGPRPVARQSVDVVVEPVVLQQQINPRIRLGHMYCDPIQLHVTDVGLTSLHRQITAITSRQIFQVPIRK